MTKLTFSQDLHRLRQSFNRRGGPATFTAQREQQRLIKKLYAKHGLEIRLYTSACPEQYEVYRAGKQVAYYRLRHGGFRVDVPDALGKEIFYAEPSGDGIFDSDERLKYLSKALHAVLSHLKARTV